MILAYQRTRSRESGPKELNLSRRRAQLNLISNWITIFLTVLTLIQGFAFNYLASRLPSVYEDAKSTREYIVAAHLGLCLVILVRMYQTFMTAVLDYDFLRPRSFEILLMTTIGLAEFFLFSSLKDGTVKNFSPSSFHGRGLLFSGIAGLGYFLILSQFVLTRRKGIPRNLIPFRLINPGVARSSRVTRIRGLFFPQAILRIKYRKPVAYSREVWLQEINIFSLLVVMMIEVWIVVFRPQSGKLIGLVLATIGILCMNIYYSTRATFGRKNRSKRA